MSATTNAGVIARRYSATRARWDAGLRSGLRAIAIAVENRYSDNLTGSGAPGSYPVPIRTGTLRRGASHRVGAREAFVFNPVVYARAVERGYHPYGNRRARRIAARPALANAVRDTDATSIMVLHLGRAVSVGVVV